MAEPDAEVFALRLRLERALGDHADMYQQVSVAFCSLAGCTVCHSTSVIKRAPLQVEIGKRERMLASAEIEGLKKYHFKEMHELQDQLLAQRSVVSKLTLRLQEAIQVHHCFDWRLLSTELCMIPFNTLSSNHVLQSSYAAKSKPSSWCRQHGWGMACRAASKPPSFKMRWRP